MSCYLFALLALLWYLFLAKGTLADRVPEILVRFEHVREVGKRKEVPSSLVFARVFL